MSEAGGAVAATLNALFGGTGNNNNSQNSMPRSLGTTVSMGFTLIILRIVASAVEAAKEDMADCSARGNRRPVSGDALAEVLYRGDTVIQFLRNFLHRMIVQRGTTTRRITKGSDKDDDEEEEDEDNVPVIHEGSCHCQAVRFELIAPQKIVCRVAEAAKIQFRHIRVRAKSFRLVKGAHHVRMYYVSKPSSVSPQALDTGAHSFCSRCGVHFLHAPNSTSTALDVNVDCLHLDTDGSAKIKVRPGSKATNLSAGVPLVGQWDQQQQDADGFNNHRYPATIAEEASPMMLFPTHENQSASPSFSSTYQNNLLAGRGTSTTTGGWDSFDNKSGSTSTIDLVFPTSGASVKARPPTPSTVYTTQTEGFYTPSQQSGVPPTLTLDTRDCANDAESVISLSSAKACFPTSTTARTHPAGLDSFVGEELGSPPSNTGILPSTTPLVRHQLLRYMKKHMSSSSSVGSSSSMISPRSSQLRTTNKRDSLSSTTTGVSNQQQEGAKN